jgi:hypothetical protein
VPPEYLELPPGFNPRTAALAAEMRRDPRLAAGGPAMLVEAALERLRTGNYQYTLDPGVYGQHTADEFWFDRREGFLRAHCLGVRRPDACDEHSGAHRHRLPGRRAQSRGWLLGGAAKRCPRVDRGVAGRPRLGASRPNLGRGARAHGSLQRLQVPRRVLEPHCSAACLPDIAASLRAAWEALNNSWNQWVLNYTQGKQLDLLRNLGFETPGWEDLAYVLLLIHGGGRAVRRRLDIVGAQPARSVAEALESRRKRLDRAGIELPPTAPPRQIATAVTTRFGERASGLADWLLKLETQRYARSPAVTLKTLQREFKQLAWPL